MIHNKFKFNDIVQVCSSHLEHREINKKTGSIRGMSCDENGVWNYAVLFENLGVTWCVDEEFLSAAYEAYDCPKSE